MMTQVNHVAISRKFSTGTQSSSKIESFQKFHCFLIIRNIPSNLREAFNFRLNNVDNLIVLTDTQT